MGAYDVRANQRQDCFGAILMDRGDRYSWTGDAYPSQAASLVAFSNYEEVLKNLKWTDSHPNNIETYELYWVESLIDYYMYSGDTKGFHTLLPQAMASFRRFRTMLRLENGGLRPARPVGSTRPSLRAWAFGIFGAAIRL